ncbi:MAG: phenylalanine--tRNA ligase subunit alpha, partial [Gammaproteobacteria bacterium]|nr:phenylalanine--tRNA ligase subunit alpha [Gammaproteobacteria bacterium]
MSEAGSLVDELRALEREARDAITGTSDPAALEQVRVAFLGRREGRVSRILRQLGGLGPEARPAVGAEANRVKRVLRGALEERERRFARERAGSGTPARDLTLPGRDRWRGARHPVTLVVDEICDIFARLGFTRARGPEAETEWYNFVALNTPLDHPAADEQDTL